MPKTQPTGARDTIVAIATPPGRGGIGIVRLSGPEALSIAAPLLRLRTPLVPGRARFCEIVDPEPVELPGLNARENDRTVNPNNPVHPNRSARLDEAVATWFAAPHSYTGEHVLEIAAHGSPILLDFLLRHTMARGARLANPGEFTERAFLSGRLDLTQAEAVRDLIDAQTLYQARVAAAQLDGALSRTIAPSKALLVQLIAQLEAGIDFAEDDTPTLSFADFLTQATPIAHSLHTLAHSFEHGRLVHSGLTLAIVGEPNVGKSSLFNRLVERERAIVTATPGTTRDLVTERISIGGLPVELVDTAGLRTAALDTPLDQAELLGIEKSRQALADADLILLVLDLTTLIASAPNALSLPYAIKPLTQAAHERDCAWPEAWIAAQGLLASFGDRPSILVLNKSDLLAKSDLDRVDPLASIKPPGLVPDTPPPRLHIRELQDLLSNRRNGLLGNTAGRTTLPPVVLTSAQTGEGLAELREAVTRHLQTPSASEQAGLLTNLRQHQSVSGAHASLTAAIESASAQVPQEMLLLDLYAALHHLDTLTGTTTSEDILGLIFSTFCIGK